MPQSNTHAGSLFMVAAPSGAGKSTLVNALLAKEPDLRLSISYTTRPPRPGEVDGQQYHFTSAPDFLKRKNNNEFLECAEVHGNYYGTSRIPINQYLQGGTDVLLEIDWQGVQQVKAQFPEAVSIFILPPSIDALKQRLEKRGQDSVEVITRRLSAARGEITHVPEFEYVIINEQFEIALSELIAVIKATRFKQPDATATRCRYKQQLERNPQLFKQFGLFAQFSFHPDPTPFTHF